MIAPTCLGPRGFGFRDLQAFVAREVGPREVREERRDVEKKRTESRKTSTDNTQVRLYVDPDAGVDYCPWDMVSLEIESLVGTDIHVASDCLS